MSLEVILGIIGLLAVLLVGLLFYKRSSPDGSRQRRRIPVDDQGQVVQPPVRGVAGRRGGPRMRRGRAEQANAEDEDEEGVDAQRVEREELEEAGVKVPEGKIGKKKMEKLQAKADKKLQREAEEREREESKKKKEQEEEDRKKEEAQRKVEEERREEEEKRRREEKERREYEEYLKMKAAFSVEEEGYDENAAEGDEENQLVKFVNYIKEKKVVLLEDLAAHFKMKTQDTIDRVQKLQEDGLLTGVIDDRGKFIFISPEELEAVAKFIRQRGRVSITELAESSNKLIALNPDKAAVKT